MAYADASSFFVVVIVAFFTFTFAFAFVFVFAFAFAWDVAADCCCFVLSDPAGVPANGKKKFAFPFYDRLEPSMGRGRIQVVCIARDQAC